MAVQVAVVDPLPMFRQGVATVLSAAGHDVETPADVLAWVRRGRRQLVLLTLVREPDWDLLERLCDEGGTHAVIAVIGEDDPGEIGARAVRTGARSVLEREVTPGALRRTVEATADGQAVMPAAVASALSSGPRSADAVPEFLSARRLSWLRQLAAGSTVAQLAKRSGYSERAMFRMLQTLYQEMGVSTRIEAIVRAQAEGWLRADAERTGDTARGSRGASG
ncbi:hypothetical protein [Nonomuraea sp. NPDC049504]|uniref:hypothetical protein n=1 Tax=Nonomuraea sp. NPDC049504 TaxID=3154729 RepID=UPI0034233613